MLEATVIRQINAPVNVVWAVLDDFGDIQRWSPGVKRSHMISEGPVRLGATRHCDFRPFGHALERIVAYEPETRMTVALDAVTFVPLSAITSDFRLRAHGGGTELTCCYSGTPSRLTRPLSGILQRQMQKGLEAIVSGLQRECERVARMTVG